MHTRSTRWPVFTLATGLICLGAGCSENAPSPAQSDPTVGPPQDSGSSGAADTADTADTGDTGTVDVDVPIVGLGQISGDCGVLDEANLTGEETAGYRNSIDFGPHGFLESEITEGSQEILDEGNLGGSSIYSEVMAWELLARCELATLLKTEGEIAYIDSSGKKTDLLVEVDTYTIGVSVTRAMSWPIKAEYTQTDASNLLNDKLEDITKSTENVAKEDAWTKQILYILAYSDSHAEAILQAYLTVDPKLASDTLVMVSSTDGDDAFIYE